MPFALGSLSIAAPCTHDMVAWLRPALRASTGEPGWPGEGIVELDIDLCDQDGTICVRMRGVALRVLDMEAGMSSPVTTADAGRVISLVAENDAHFDADFYRRIIDSVSRKEVSVDEAARLG
jgi:hypothetical protein